MKERAKYPISRSPPLCKHLLDYTRNVMAERKKQGKSIALLCSWKLSYVKYVPRIIL